MDFFNQLAMKIHLKMSFVKLIGNENILNGFFFPSLAKKFKLSDQKWNSSTTTERNAEIDKMQEQKTKLSSAFFYIIWTD